MKALIVVALATLSRAFRADELPSQEFDIDGVLDPEDDALPLSYLSLGLSHAGAYLNKAEKAFAESGDNAEGQIEVTSLFGNKARAPTYLQYGTAGAQNVLRAMTNTRSQENATAEIKKLQELANKNIEKALRNSRSGCTSENIVRRKEWGTLSEDSRLAYIKAVKCLQQKPPRTAKSVAPGARSRYDDFAVLHIIKTPIIHFSGLFLPFHRHFTWLYEKALREECGYTGTQPYWDWSLSWKDLSKSTVFDGSPTSLGSNGESIPHGVRKGAAFGLPLLIPPGSGGGCVQSGPFSESEYNMTLGPVGFLPRGPSKGLGFNPRCLKRDFSVLFSSFTKATDMLSLLSRCTDVGCFDHQFEAPPGVHAGGHGAIGGDPDNDIYASPTDPAFWLHHSSIDRMWTIWQNLDSSARMSQTSGTQTAFNGMSIVPPSLLHSMLIFNAMQVPPSEKVTLDTSITFGVLGEDKTVGSVTSTTEDEYCYMYV